MRTMNQLKKKSYQASGKFGAIMEVWDTMWIGLGASVSQGIDYPAKRSESA